MRDERVNIRLLDGCGAEKAGDKGAASLVTRSPTASAQKRWRFCVKL